MPSVDMRQFKSTVPLVWAPVEYRTVLSPEAEETNKDRNITKDGAIRKLVK
jgi:hypothetical protein